MSVNPQMSPQMFARTIHVEKKGAFIDSENPKVYLTQGMRGGGKSLLDEMIAEQLHIRGWTVLDLLGARNMENLYWCINKNCREEYLSEVRLDPKQKGKAHCNCNRKYPVTILCPEYIEFDQESIDKFNNKYYTKEQFLIERTKPKSKIYGAMEFDKNHPPETGIPPQIKIRKLQPPTTTGTNKDIVVQQFYEAVFEARRERRIICMNPMLFPNEFHRYKTLEIIIRSFQQLMYNHFKPDETKRKNWNKMCVLMREFGEVTANILKGENQSTLTKKALLQYIRQTRHYGITLIGDYQRPDDVFPSIREQADIFLLKRAPEKLLGVGWEWIFKDIMNKRQRFYFDKYGKNAFSINQANKFYPMIQQLANNYCYVVYIDNSYKLIKIPTPNFHHHQQPEHFEIDTGITWKELPHTKLTKGVARSELSVTKEFEKNDSDEKLFRVIENEIEEGKRPSWDKILVKLTQLSEAGAIVIPTSWSNKDAIRKWHSRKKKAK